MFDYLYNYIERKEAVEMIYQADSGAITQRSITIYGKTNQHLKAYCHTRRKMRIFKLKNILSIQPRKKRGFNSL